MISLATSCAALSNFSKPSEVDYIDKGVKMDIKKFFNGDVEGSAIIQDENGKIIATQTIKANGKWEENKGVLQQNFVNNSGEKDSRTWLITLNEDGTIDAVGHDVAAPAKGKQIGNAAQMSYALILRKKGEKEEIKFDDKMYLVDDKSMIIISEFKKGFSGKGRAIISFRKSANSSSN